VWAGNSDSSPVTTVANPVFSLDVAAPVWDGFLSEVTRRWAVNGFARPRGLERARVDAFTGYTPSQWSQRQVDELFLEGTRPGRDPYLRGVEVVRGSDGQWYLWSEGCAVGPRTRGFLDFADAESHHAGWNAAVEGWVRRARRGPGVGADVSPVKTTYTAYFYEPYFQPYGATWGGPFVPLRDCGRAPVASPSPSPSLWPFPSGGPGGSPGEKPTLPPLPEPTAEPTPEPTVEPTPGPTRPPKPTRPPRPTPEPTPEPLPTDPPLPTEPPAPGITKPPA
jgi:hypothetical protein